MATMMSSTFSVRIEAAREITERQAVGLRIDRRANEIRKSADPKDAEQQHNAKAGVQKGPAVLFAREHARNIENGQTALAKETIKNSGLSLKPRTYGALHARWQESRLCKSPTKTQMQRCTHLRRRRCSSPSVFMAR